MAGGWRRTAELSRRRYALSWYAASKTSGNNHLDQLCLWHMEGSTKSQADALGLHVLMILFEWMDQGRNHRKYKTSMICLNGFGVICSINKTQGFFTTASHFAAPRVNAGCCCQLAGETGFIYFWSIGSLGIKRPWLVGGGAQLNWVGGGTR